MLVRWALPEENRMVEKKSLPEAALALIEFLKQNTAW